MSSMSFVWFSSAVRTRSLAARAALIASLAAASTIVVPSAHAQNVYVAAYYDQQIYAYTPSGANLGLFASSPADGSRYIGMAVNSLGDVYVGSNGAVGGTAGFREFSPTGTQLSFTPLSFDGAMAVGAGDTLYVGNYNNGQILKYSATGAYLGVFATTFSGLEGFAFDGFGNLYASNQAATVEKFSPTGQDLGAFLTGQNGATGLAFTNSGNLLVGERGNDTVRLYSPTGQDLGVFANSSNGIADPLSIAVDAAGGIYVGNQVNPNGTSHVEKFSATGADLGAFATGNSFSAVATYRVLGGAAAPEPGSVALLAASILPVALCVRRARRTQRLG